MLKKTITYKDLDNNDRTEDFYFHLTKAELVKLELSHEGGMQQRLIDIIGSGNGQAIMDAFEEILALSYGKRTPEGAFDKNPKHFQLFKTSEAYSQLFMQLVTDSGFSAEFINGIVPKGLAEEAAKEIQNTKIQFENAPADERPAWIRENRDPTREEMSKMSTAEMAAAFQARIERKAGD